MDAEVLGTYTEDFYAGGAALTCRRLGEGASRGAAYYMAARTESSAMVPLFEKMLTDAGIAVRRMPEGVEYHVRTGEEGVYEFYLNCSGETVRVEDVRGLDLVTGNTVNGSLVLDGYGVAVVRA